MCCVCVCLCARVCKDRYVDRQIYLSICLSVYMYIYRDLIHLHAGSLEKVDRHLRKYYVRLYQLFIYAHVYVNTKIVLHACVKHTYIYT